MQDKRLEAQRAEDEYFRVRAYIKEEALRHNIRVARDKIGPEVLLAGVVKADAYGHGAKEVARILEEEGADYLAVAIIEEGIKLRRQGIRLPILVLGYTDPSEYPAAIENQIHVTIYTKEQAEQLSNTAQRLQHTGLVHIKLETGMGRIGFASTPESAENIRQITQLPGLQVDGIFTHFARADEADKSMAKEQQKRYDAFLKQLEETGVQIPIHHIANSAAIMEYPQAHRSHEKLLEYPYQKMARAGIMLYGLYPSEEMDRKKTDLWPVLSLVSHIVHLKVVEKGTPIGYGGSYVAPSTRTIATIPVGYGDGYPRRLSNQGYVMIRGCKAPITGRICMDQFMVDVTDIEGVHLGDEAILIGPGVEAGVLAELTDTIHYELTCQLTERVPRVLTSK